MTIDTSNTQSTIDAPGGSTVLDPNIVTLANGNFAAVWSVGGKVYYRRYDADGDSLDPERIVLLGFNSQYGNPDFHSAITLKDGSIYVTFDGYEGVSTTDLAIYGQRFDSDMQPIDPVPTKITSTFNNLEADLVLLSGGSFLASWYEGDYESGKVYVRAYDATGKEIAGTFQQLSTNSTTAIHTHLAAMGGNRFVFSYEVNNDIYHNIYQLSGGQITTIASGIRTDVGTPLSQAGVEVAGLKNGGFVAVWQSGDGAAAGIYQRVFDANGNAVAFGSTTASQENLVNNLQTAGNQIYPSVAAMDNGGWVVVWRQDGTASENPGIYVRVYNDDGYAFTDHVFVTSNYSNPKVKALDGNSFVVTWQGSAGSIYEKVFDLSGSTILGDANSNTIWGTFLDDSIEGRAGNDIIYGYSEGGNDNDVGDYIDGGTGSDTMSGGLGDDIYVVDTATAQGITGDKVIEFAGEGIDKIISSIDFSLATLVNVENLSLTGTSNLSATGNILDNLIGGNAGSNVIDGGAGKDTMTGWAGDDIYIIDNVDDTVVELDGRGTDKLLLGIAGAQLTDEKYANVENAQMTGSANGTLGGSAGDNRLIGNIGRNTLNGRAGEDVLTGGDGVDIFIFRPNYGKDIITDFDGSEDQIDVSSFTDVHQKSQFYRMYQNSDGTDAVIEFNTGDKLILRDTVYQDLLNNDFIFAA
jgi:hypothetical protein